MESVYRTTKKGRVKYRRGDLSGDEMKVIEYLKDNRSATMSQLEVATCEPWLVRSMARKGLIREKEE